jgi:TolB protein
VRRSHLGVWFVVLVAVALVSALLVGGAHSASRPSGLIAFARADGIYVMRADGSGMRAIRRGGAVTNARSLGWSPDGRKLAFGANAEIWVMNADGSGLVRLASRGAGAPSWSPDGRRIAFTRGDIWVMNADGSNPQRLVRTPRLNEIEVDWSPAGGRFVFTSLVGYVPSVHVMNADGSNVRDLTPDRFFPLEPRWSPDGRRIAVTSWGNASGSEEIYVVNANSRKRVRLTWNEVADRTPAWSPDGRKIAFVRSDVDYGSTDEIYVMDADGSGVRRLTHNQRAEASPAWQPVGAP